MKKSNNLIVFVLFCLVCFFGFCLFVLHCFLLTERHATENIKTNKETNFDATVTQSKMWSDYPRTVMSEVQMRSNISIKSACVRLDEDSKKN